MIALLGKNYSNFVIGPAITVFSNTSTSVADVTGVTVSIFSNGGPVFIGLIPSGAGSSSNASQLQFNSATASAGGFLNILNNTTGISYFTGFEGTGAPSNTFISNGPGVLWTIDVPAAGTNAYKLQYKCFAGSNFTAANFAMFAYEMN